MKDITEQWRLLVPSIAALGMYALVHVELRYIGPFLVLLWMGVAFAVRLPDSPESKRLITRVIIAMLAVMTVAIGTAERSERTSLASAAYSTAHDLIRGQDPSAHVQWQVGNNLSHLGVRRGDKVAVIGDSFRASFWARLARVQIIAEIPTYRDRAREEFWAAEPLVKSQVIRAFATAGAKVIVAEWAPPDAATAAGWRKLGNTPYYVYLLTGHVGDT